MAYNGENYKPELIGSNTANKCDANVNTEFKLKMNEVSCTPNYHFNLFSIGKKLRQVWNLGGSNESMCIEKYGCKVKFDGKITTTKGLIYYMFHKHNIEFAVTSIEYKNKITLKHSHDVLGNSKKYMIIIIIISITYNMEPTLVHIRAKV